MNVDHEVDLLVEEMHRLGTRGPPAFQDPDKRQTEQETPETTQVEKAARTDEDGKVCVKFGVLFNDEKIANTFEALVGTLKAAKRKKILKYNSELLLQGVHDDIDIVLLQE